MPRRFHPIEWRGGPVMTGLVVNGPGHLTKVPADEWAGTDACNIAVYHTMWLSWSTLATLSCPVVCAPSKSQ